MRIPQTTPPTNIDVLALLLTRADEVVLEVWDVGLTPSGLSVIDCTGVDDDKVGDNAGVDAVGIFNDAVVDPLESGQWVIVLLSSDT